MPYVIFAGRGGGATIVLLAGVGNKLDISPLFQGSTSHIKRPHDRSVLCHIKISMDWNGKEVGTKFPFRLTLRAHPATR